MKNEIKISIITVCYNAEKTIEKTIQSVISQTYKNWEYIIVDGASEDATIEVVNKYKDCFTKIVSEPDKGIYDAMNKGIRLATGDFICLLNADDSLSDNAFRTLIDNIGFGNTYDVYHGDIVYFTSYNSEGKRYQPRLALWYPQLIGMPFFHPTMYVHIRVYKNLLYDTKYRLLSDYKLVQEIILKNYKVKYIPEVLAHFYAGGTSDDNFYLGYREGQAIRKELGFSKLTIWMSSILRMFSRYTIKAKRALMKKLSN